MLQALHPHALQRAQDQNQDMSCEANPHGCRRPQHKRHVEHCPTSRLIHSASPQKAIKSKYHRYAPVRCVPIDLPTS